VSEHVEVIEIGVRWDPYHAVPVGDAKGRAALRLRPDLDDSDQRDVVLIWTGCRSAEIGDPNDEALSGHRLYELGLSEVTWIGEVTNSESIAKLELVNRVHHTTSLDDLPSPPLHRATQGFHG
jgi:hypothetical protein